MKGVRWFGTEVRRITEAFSAHVSNDIMSKFHPRPVSRLRLDKSASDWGNRHLTLYHLLHQHKREHEALSSRRASTAFFSFYLSKIGILQEHGSRQQEAAVENKNTQANKASSRNHWPSP